MNTYLTLFYTHKNEDYKVNIKKHLENYKKIGIKDVFLYMEDCLPKEFELLYKDFFKKNYRGYGYWAWKPLVIYDSMKKINENDMILYHDVGRQCYPFGIRYDINGISSYIRDNHDGIGVARGPFDHKEYCKRDAFYYMNCDEENCWNLKQLSATWSFWQKSELPKRMLLDWMKYAFHDKNIITDDPNQCGLNNFSPFEGHRHDQAILTNLFYLYHKEYPKIEALTAPAWEKDLNHFIKKYDPNPKLIIPEIINKEKDEIRIIERLNFQKEENSKIRNDTTVVVNHFNEDLNWLKDKNRFFNIVLCDKKGSKEIPDLIKNQIDCTSCPIDPLNKGKEAIGYLLYIIKNYKKLSERTAFIHGHETAWHYLNPLSLSDAILTARTDKYGFISLNIKHHPDVEPGRHPLGNYDLRILNDAPWIFLKKYWNEYFQKYLGDIPKEISHDCCGQFIVRKDRILKHPIEAYIKWLYLCNVSKEDHTFALVFELIWHIIFGEEPSVPQNQRNLNYFKARFLGIDLPL
jgi:hypothetical protein